MNTRCIILIGHITNTNQVSVLKNAISGIRKHAPLYPILLSVSGNIEMMGEVVDKVDHFIVTSLNKLHVLDRENTSFSVWFRSDNWKIERQFVYPIHYYGYAQLQKTALALQTAMLNGCKNFLVMNYDSLIMDDTFVESMFNEQHSVFFGFENPPIRMNSDVFKLNEEGAKTVIDFTLNEQLYLELSEKADFGMLEDILGLMLNRYRIPYTRYSAYNDRALQIYPFKVLINLMSSGNDCLAAIRDGTVYMLITHMGHPIHAVNGQLEIECEGVVHNIDVSTPRVELLPIAKYKGEDVDIIIRNQFGEFPMTLKTTALENTHITYT